MRSKTPSRTFFTEFFLHPSVPSRYFAALLIDNVGVHAVAVYAHNWLWKETLRQTHRVAPPANQLIQSEISDRPPSPNTFARNQKFNFNTAEDLLRHRFPMSWMRPSLFSVCWESHPRICAVILLSLQSVRMKVRSGSPGSE